MDSSVQKGPAPQLQKRTSRKTPAPARVVFVVGQLVYGGTERQLLVLATHIDKERIAPHIICLSERADLLNEFSELEVPVTIIPRERLGRIRTLYLLTKHLRALNPDVVQAFSFAWYYAILAAFFSPVRTVIVGERGLAQWKRWWHYLVDRVLLKIARRAIVNSKKVAENLHQRQGVPCEAVEVIYNGIDLKWFDDCLLTGKMSFDYRREKTICAVASHRKEKGVDILLKAFETVCKRRSDVTLWLIGNGVQTEHLRDYALQRGIAKKVVFWGNRSDVPGFLNAASIGVLSSRTEGLPNAIIEYMAARLPVVATNVGGNAELVVDGKTGVLVPPNDPEALADAICFVLDHPDIACKYGEAGRRRVEEHFTVERMVRQTEQLYEKLLSKSEVA